MANVRLSADVQWLTSRILTDEERAAIDADAPIRGLELGQAVDDARALGVPAPELDAIVEAYRGRGAEFDEVLAGALSRARERGEWGAILDRQRVYRALEVVGLAAPDSAGATTTASFSFSVKGEAGLKVSVGVFSLGVTGTYVIEDTLELECDRGEAKVASLLLPLDRVRMQFKPAGGDEWFERVRLEPVLFDAQAPNIGVRADAVPVEQLLERRRLPGTPIGSGSAALKRTVKQSAALSISAELGPKLRDDAGSLTVSASVSGEVTSEVAYELPANASFQQFWLTPIAGACIVAG